MSLLLPRRPEIPRERLEAVLAESVEAAENAVVAAEEISASADADLERLEAARDDIRRRGAERQERVRRSAVRDPGLSAVTDVLRLLESRR